MKDDLNGNQEAISGGVESCDQFSLFDMEELQAWKEEWRDMPEFSHKNLEPIKQIIVSFVSIEDIKKFSNIIGQKITLKTQSIWFPRAKIDKYMDKRYTSES